MVLVNKCLRSTKVLVFFEKSQWFTTIQTKRFKDFLNYYSF